MAKEDKDLAFANRFRRCCIENGWRDYTRKELGKALDISDTCATFYMNGDRLPSMAQAIKMADVFGVCVEWLLTGRGDMRPISSFEDMIDISGFSDEGKAAIKLMVATFTKH